MRCVESGHPGLPERFLPRLERGYERFLRFAGQTPTLVFFFGTASLMVVAFAPLGAFPPKVEFFPSNEPQYLNIFITKPIGTDIEETNASRVRSKAWCSKYSTRTLQAPEPRDGRTRVVHGQFGHRSGGQRNQ